MPDSFIEEVERGLGKYGYFDPEGGGYDYETAKLHGIKPDADGHWQSRSPVTGQMLKGRKHKTWHLSEEGEANAGYTIYKDPESGRYFSTDGSYPFPNKSKKR